HGQSGLTTAERGIDWLEERWKSFSDSSIGKEFLYGFAAAHFGFAEGKELLDDAAAAANAKLADGMFLNGNANDTASADAADGSADGAGVGGDGQGGGSGPTPFNDTHQAIADLFIAQHRDRWRYNIDARRWYNFDGCVWRPNDGVLNDIQALVVPIAQQIL